MKFIKALLRALLVQSLFQQADTQNAVTVTIVESGPNVLMEWSGSLAVLPTFSFSSPANFVFSSSSERQYVNSVVVPANANCKYITDYMFVLAAPLVISHALQAAKFLTMHFLTGYAGDINNSGFQSLTTNTFTTPTASSATGMLLQPFKCLPTLQNGGWTVLFTQPNTCLVSLSSD